MMIIIQVSDKHYCRMINRYVEDDDSMPENIGLGCLIRICVCKVCCLQSLFRFMIRVCVKCFTFVYR